MAAARWVHRLRYFVADAWDEWRHSPGTNLLAVTTLATTLFLAGLAALIVSNLQHQLELQRQDVAVHVYLVEDITPQQRAALQREAVGLPGVAQVEYVDKDEALRRYREWAGDAVAVLEQLESNPLPASLEIRLQPGPQTESQGEAVVSGLAGREGIEAIRFERDWLRRLEAILDLARIGGSGLALFVFAAVVVVMASVLRLAVYARRDEIEIMLLVGATPAFVRGPFLVAGLAQGALAAVLALLMVEGSRRAALGHAGGSGVALLDVLLSRSLPAGVSAWLLLISLVVATTSAFFAVRRSL